MVVKLDSYREGKTAIEAKDAHGIVKPINSQVVSQFNAVWKEIKQTAQFKAAKQSCEIF
jgi:hypothetical protein